MYTFIHLACACVRMVWLENQKSSVTLKVDTSCSSVGSMGSKMDLLENSRLKHIRYVSKVYRDRKNCKIMDRLSEFYSFEHALLHDLHQMYLCAFSFVSFNLSISSFSWNTLCDSVRFSFELFCIARLSLIYICSVGRFFITYFCMNAFQFTM